MLSGEVSWNDVANLARRDDRTERGDTFVYRYDRVGPFDDQEIEKTAADATDRILRTTTDQFGVRRDATDDRSGERYSRRDNQAAAIHFSLAEPPSEQLLRQAEEAVVEACSRTQAGGLEKIPAGRPESVEDGERFSSVDEAREVGSAETEFRHSQSGAAEGVFFESHDDVMELASRTWRMGKRSRRVPLQDLLEGEVVGI